LFFIRWQHIIELHQLQQQEGLRAGNQLQEGHLEWKKQQMKVKLALQVMSRQSLSDGIYFCREKTTIPIQRMWSNHSFFRNFDMLFDLMNSKNVLGTGF